MANKRMMRGPRGLEPFYNDTVRSTQKLTTSNFNGISFFQEQEDSTIAVLRDYKLTQGNPSRTGVMRLLSLRAALDGDDFAVLDLRPTIAAGVVAFAKRSAYEKFRKCGLIEVSIGTDVIHKDRLSNFLPPAPLVGGPIVEGTPATNAAYQPTNINVEDGGGNGRLYRKYGWFCEPPMRVDKAKVEPVLKFPSGFGALSAQLVDHYLSMFMAFETIDVQSQQQVRE